eukprot:g78683.t1
MSPSETAVAVLTHGNRATFGKPTNGNGATFWQGREKSTIFFPCEKRVDVGKNRPSVSYTAPLLEVVGGIESSAKGLFVGAKALAKLSRLAAFFSAGNQSLAMEGSEVGGRVCLLFDLGHSML